MASEQQQRLSQAERNNLVAYLDGELNEAEARAIATKLTASVTARRDVELLERTWDLLDHLPRPRASAELTARTLTGAAQVARQGDEILGVAGQAMRRVLQGLACLATAAATLAFGYAAARWLWPDPTARLERDLSIAENLDAYRAVGSFEFLKLLDDNPDALD